jgi:hypothetical protein
MLPFNLGLAVANNPMNVAALVIDELAFDARYFAAEIGVQMVAGFLGSGGFPHLLANSDQLCGFRHEPAFTNPSTGRGFQGFRHQMCYVLRQQSEGFGVRLEVSLGRRTVAQAELPDYSPDLRRHGPF